VKVLPAAEWRPLADAHAARVDEFVEPHLARRADRIKHPVHDFLFTYYSQRPAQLRRWHPGHGVALADADAYVGLKGYATEPVTVTSAYVVSQRPLVAQLHTLLTATAGRAPQFGCFGLHEWAMVHRASAAGDGTRH
jgi:hypothetical protein